MITAKSRSCYGVNNQKAHKIGFAQNPESGIGRAPPPGGGVLPYMGYIGTVKPVLIEHRIRRRPSIKRTVAEVPKFISPIYFT